ncbi:hypothetical protein WKU33_02865 [Oceanobacillus sp. HCA-5259]|uniref:hypothetical protein n=1 Tax=Oceanobacillus sp. HCA-5259 TaxID=3134661 RepID=UPI0030C41F71
MKDKNVRTGKLLSRIGGIICLAIAGVMLFISMVTPVALKLNGEQYFVSLWEMASYPSAFLFWMGILFYLVVLGLAGLFISKKVSVMPTKGYGITLILLGFPALPIMGAGVFYIIAGVHIVLAAGMKNLQNSI